MRCRVVLESGPSTETATSTSAEVVRGSNANGASSRVMRSDHSSVRAESEQPSARHDTASAGTWRQRSTCTEEGWRLCPERAIARNRENPQDFRMKFKHPLASAIVILGALLACKSQKPVESRV